MKKQQQAMLLALAVLFHFTNAIVFQSNAKLSQIIRKPQSKEMCLTNLFNYMLYLYNYYVNEIFHFFSIFIFISQSGTFPILVLIQILFVLQWVCKRNHSPFADFFNHIHICSFATNDDCKRGHVATRTHFYIKYSV